MKKVLIITLLGMCWFPMMAFGDECVEGDCVNGTGEMIYSTGHQFSGGFKDGMRHGKGVLQLPGGRKMVGIWENNEIKEGTSTESDGTTYTGQWQFREREGQGTMTWPDGRKYTGSFKDGQRHGKGIMIYPDGRKYDGDYQYGERTGKGSMIYPDGRKYIGEFKDGERTGQGKLIHPDGREQVGEFRNGEFVGK